MKKTLFALCMILIGLTVPEQSALGADTFLQQYGATYRFQLGRPHSITLTPDGDAVLFLRSGPRNFRNDLYEFDVPTGQERKVLSAETLLGSGDEKITPEELARRERMRLAGRGIVGYSLSKDGSRLLVPLSGRLFVVDRTSGEHRELEIGDSSPIDPRFSPDASHVAYVSGGELFVVAVDGGGPKQLTSGASETVEHGLAEFVAQEEMDRMRGYWFSPDGSQLAYQQTDVSQVEMWHIADPTHPELPGRAWPYPRPGKHNAEVRLGVVAASGGATTWVEWDRSVYPYLAEVTWSENAPLTILVQNRTQTEQLLLAVDPASGATTELLREVDAAWINIDNAMPRWLESGESFLWTTERQGAWQLEKRNRDGSLAAVLTPPAFGYRGLVGVDRERNEALVAGGADPVSVALYRVSLDPKGLGYTQVSPERQGIHSAQLAKHGGTMVRWGATLEGPEPHQVIRGDGTVAGELKSVAEALPLVPNVELTTVGTSPSLHAVVVRPRDFDKDRKYPVIVSVYGGPHAQMVMATRDKYLLNQWFADQGFIVVSIDGRGTPGRGREWERAIKGNVIAGPLDDQVRGLQALGAKYPEMDLERVGMYGWSFGGYFSAMAVMMRPDVFHAGVAGAPVVDWRDYDTHYTERYMGLPDENREGYDAASALTYAAGLRRPLLLIHGTADDNVYFLHSMKLCDALFREGKDFDFLPLTGFTHMVPDPLVTERLYSRVADFLAEHLKAK